MTLNNESTARGITEEDLTRIEEYLRLRQFNPSQDSLPPTSDPA